ncbi:hypothetical protein C6I20_14930 [Aeromicrobium sp. A1-2]|uniref:hypothetical protein n=1 Tax=Aeromicrobium sp. A1-2 TaxID=2107713 RepID=UPI000E4B01C1|nr:hypothetical protein [Aeromicrobium sp. A1-2]AXT86341.1 hypothetical protein C6I20_14930 [Aeromicrobium sp. A1-2]
MPRPFKKKTLRIQLEDRLEGLTEQTEELRQQVADRAPVVRDQLIDMLPDKDQLRDLRDDLFDRLPENVQDRLPERVKPKRSKLKRIAVLGILAGAGAAAVAAVRGRVQSAPAPDPFPRPQAAPAPQAAPTPKPAPTHAAEPVAEPTDGTDDKSGGKKS